ncbi:hypothetical protein [Ruegeria atlantica]|nr:hypothetical protein [Ruegeria atlantica]
MAWDDVSEHDESGNSQSDVLAEPLSIQNVPEVTQIGTETHERLDW